MKPTRRFIVLSLLLLSPLTTLHAAEGGASKPNIVIFIADDLTWHDVACFGGPTDARTPHLDRLASEGLKLTGFFSPASVCSPTRQSLLTGMYPVRTGAYGTRCVRDTRWKLIVNLEPDAEFSNAISNGGLLQSWRRKGEAGDAFARAQAARYTKRPAVELYDLQTDPWELTNVAATPANADTLTRLRTQLDAWMKQQGDEGDKTEREANQHQGAGGAKRAGQKKANPKKHLQWPRWSQRARIFSGRGGHNAPASSVAALVTTRPPMDPRMKRNAETQRSRRKTRRGCL